MEHRRHIAHRVLVDIADSEAGVMFVLQRMQR